VRTDIREAQTALETACEAAAADRMHS
jgi:hypothetical protein